jgi:hypothetical protein
MHISHLLALYSAEVVQQQAALRLGMAECSLDGEVVAFISKVLEGDWSF